jgi:hypothetical protein
MESLPAIISDLIAFHKHLEEGFDETSDSKPILLENGEDEPGVRLWKFGQKIDVEAAIAQLQESERGAQAFDDLRTFLANGADLLDPLNMEAVINLLGAAWGGRSKEILRERD